MFNKAWVPQKIWIERPAVINFTKTRRLRLCCQLFVANPNQKPKIRGMKPCDSLLNFALPQKPRRTFIFIPENHSNPCLDSACCSLYQHYMMESFAEKPFSQSCGEGRAGNIKFFMHAKPFIVNAVYANICSSSLSIRHIGFKASWYAVPFESLKVGGDGGGGTGHSIVAFARQTKKILSQYNLTFSAEYHFLLCNLLESENIHAV